MKFSYKQQEIIDISIQLIADLGIQGFTIKNLAKRVGVTEGAIYRHFESKIKILHSILKAFQTESNKILDLACNSSQPAISEIERIFLHHINYFSKIPAIASIIFSESIFRNNNLLYQEVNKLLQTHENVLLCILTKGQQNGEIKNGEISKEHIIRIIIGSFRYTVTKWRLSNYEFDIVADGIELLKNIRLILEK